MLEPWRFFVVVAVAIAVNSCVLSLRALGRPLSGRLALQLDTAPT